MEIAIFWTAFFGVLLLAAIALAALIEFCGWHQPWMPRDDFDADHAHRERLGR